MSSDISSRMEDYLEAILRIQETHPVARVTELAEALDVSKPTVTSALKKLDEAGLVDHQTYGYIQLTDRGREAAENVRKRHGLLRRFFQDVLGVDATTAAEDACRAEHNISPETVQRLTRLIEFIQECPRTGEEWLDHFHCYCRQEETPSAVECSDSCLNRCLERIETSKAGMCQRG